MTFRSNAIHWVFQVYFLCAGIGISSNDYQYLAFFGYLLVAITIGIFGQISSSAGLPGRYINLKIQPIDLIPAAFLFIWLYGIFIGLINGNPTESLVRNFAGMVLYTNYYVLKTTNLSSRFYLSVFCVATAWNIAYPISVIVATGGELKYSVDEVGMGALRFYFSASQSVLLSAYALAICAIFVRPCCQFFSSWASRQIFSGWRKYVIIILCVIAGPVASVSKGLIAAFAIATAFVCFVVLARRFSKDKEVRKSVAVLPLMVLLFALSIGIIGLSNSDAAKILLDAYSSEELSNATRNEQRKELLADITFLGRGLGASLSSGYSRDALGYGFENSFENVVHKFGAMSIFVFLAYIATLWFFVKASLKPRLLGVGIAGFAGMLYLIPAAGNPSLFAPVNISMHVLLLLLLRTERAQNNARNLTVK